jgi:hypothetical protein
MEQIMPLSTMRVADSTQVVEASLSQTNVEGWKHLRQEG